jgi:hypothetical protein
MAISWAPGLQSEFKIASCWLYLIACAVAIIEIAIPRHAYQLVATPVTVRPRVGLAAIQVAFAVLISTLTRLISVEDYLPDHLCPDGVTATDGCLSAWLWPKLTYKGSPEGIVLRSPGASGSN